MTMKLVVGLGNPDIEYINTWHNVGIYTIQELKRLQKSGKFPKNVILKESTEFMNNSGIFVRDLMDHYHLQPSDLYVIHDDLDIRLGEEPKIQLGHGPKNHKGLMSIDEALGTNQYWHIRIGVDNRSEENRISGKDYVLQNYSDGEKQILGNTIKIACKKLVTSLANTK
jgi:peptidyl-tRNA hydrolase, PTH1 family